MDKEIADIAPETLQGVEVNTVRHSSEEDAQSAAAAEKEQKENYYVDPLEQDAIMKEKLEKIEAEKERMRKEREQSEDSDDDYYVDTSIRPDMNVSGYFSAGNTAKKEGFAKRPASKGLITFSALVGIITCGYSLIYTAVMVIDNFMSPHWLMNWFFIILIIASPFNIFNGVRTMKAKNKSLKSMALVSVVSSSVIIIPIIAWIIHNITG